MIRVHDKYGPEGLYVIGINGHDQEHTTKDVQRFVETFAARFPIALDKRGSVRRAYRIGGQPTTVFIDSDGIIRRTHTGLITRAELESGIELILPRKN